MIEEQREILVRRHRPALRRLVHRDLPGVAGAVPRRTGRLPAPARLRGGARLRHAEAGGLLRAIAPRRDVADTVANRRRKGTLAMLGGHWPPTSRAGRPARSSSALLAFTQPVRLYGHGRGGQPRLRTRPRGGRPRPRDALDRVDGPFDELAHTVDVRRLDSSRGLGRYGIEEVGPVRVAARRVLRSRARPAYCEDRDRAQFTFSILGNDTPLVVRPVPSRRPTHIADETNVPAFIRRLSVRARPATTTAPARACASGCPVTRGAEPVAAVQRSSPADLTDWAYTPAGDQVARRPGARPDRVPRPRTAPDDGVWVSYRYALLRRHRRRRVPARRLARRRRSIRVGAGQPDQTITAALAQWTADKAGRTRRREAIVELAGSAAYRSSSTSTSISATGCTIRAAPGSRPVIRLLDWYANRPDSLRITRHRGAATGAPPDGDARRTADHRAQRPGAGRPSAAARVTDCTLVPGWSLDSDCSCEHPGEPSLELDRHAGVRPDRAQHPRVDPGRSATRSTHDPTRCSCPTASSTPATASGFALSRTRRRACARRGPGAAAHHGVRADPAPTPSPGREQHHHRHVRGRQTPAGLRAVLLDRARIADCRQQFHCEPELSRRPGCGSSRGSPASATAPPATPSWRRDCAGGDRPRRRRRRPRWAPSTTCSSRSAWTTCRCGSPSTRPAGCDAGIIFVT